jgi:hypothetical protein
MNYSVFDSNGKLIAVNSAKNKQELRTKVMSSKYWLVTDRVQYGRTVYTAQEIYAKI